LLAVLHAACYHLQTLLLQLFFQPALLGNALQQILINLLNLLEKINFGRIGALNGLIILDLHVRKLLRSSFHLLAVVGLHGLSRGVVAGNDILCFGRVGLMTHLFVLLLLLCDFVQLGCVLVTQGLEPSRTWPWLR
jgi:hypothetical protein